MIVIARAGESLCDSGLGAGGHLTEPSTNTDNLVSLPTCKYLLCHVEPSCRLKELIGPGS